jgi:uncharacterized protein YacL
MIVVEVAPGTSIATWTWRRGLQTVAGRMIFAQPRPD